MPTSFITRGVFCSLLGLSLLTTTGCVSRAPSRFSRLNPAEARDLALQLAKSRDADLQEDLNSAFADHPPRNVLILSGGDAHGAFGCGVLAGWRKSAANPRPNFDIVTGVSTGALMATFAFLGEPPDDAQLADIYLHARDKDIFDGPIGGPPDAVFDTTPLRKLIAKYVTPDSLRRIAAAHHRGRRLYVATVELDTGALFIWPMSRLADEAMGSDGNVNVAKLEQFRSILLAAASVPILFPPVEIDGGLHVDAGLRATLFVHDAMLGITRASDHAANQSSPTTQPAMPNVWVIFNGQMNSNPQPVDADLLNISARSLAIYIHTVDLMSLREAGFISQNHNPPFRFRWISEPARTDPDPGIIRPMFDPRETSRWYQSGELLGAGANAWTDGPPPLEDNMAADEPVMNARPSATAR
jgi:hypothetical protein